MDVRRVVENQPPRDALVVDTADTLEHVAERPMPQIVQDGRDERRLVVRLRELEAVAAKPGEDRPGRFEDAQAVAVPAVIGPGVGEAGEAELPNPPKPLNLPARQQIEDQSIGVVVEPEGDDVVNRVADDLLVRAGHVITIDPVAKPTVASARPAVR